MLVVEVSDGLPTLACRKKSDLAIQFHAFSDMSFVCANRVF